MNIKFQADADLDVRIISGLRQIVPEIDFSTANDAGLHGLKDPEVLRISAGLGRMLVSHDRKTMPLHFHAFIAIQESPGIILTPQNASISSVIDDLLLIWHASVSGEYRNQILYIPF